MQTVGADRSRPRRGELIGLIGAVVGTWIVVIGAAMPWLTTGRVRRSAFAVARSARNLGLAEAPERRLALVLLFATPALAGVVLLALSAGKRPVALGVAGAIGALGVVGTFVGTQLPGNHGVGPYVSGSGGMLSILGIVITAIATRK